MYLNGEKNTSQSVEGKQSNPTTTVSLPLVARSSVKPVVCGSGGGGSIIFSVGVMTCIRHCILSQFCATSQGHLVGSKMPCTLSDICIQKHMI